MACGAQINAYLTLHKSLIYNDFERVAARTILHYGLVRVLQWCAPQAIFFLRIPLLIDSSCRDIPVKKLLLPMPTVM